MDKGNCKYPHDGENIIIGWKGRNTMRLYEIKIK